MVLLLQLHASHVLMSCFEELLSQGPGKVQFQFSVLSIETYIYQN